MGFASQLRSFGQCSVSSLPVSNIAEVRFQPDPKRYGRKQTKLPSVLFAFCVTLVNFVVCCSIFRPQLAVSCIRDPSAVHGAHEMLYLFDLTRGTARPLTGNGFSAKERSSL